MVLMDTPKLKNVNNVSAWGAEWQEDGGSLFQLVVPRNTATLLLGMRRDESVKWSIIPVVNVERFGITGPVTSYLQFNAVVQAFLESRTDQQEAS